MSRENWLPVEVKELYKGYHVAVFRNEKGEESLFEIQVAHSNKEFIDGYWDYMDINCWDRYSGDRPGCKHTCPIYNMPLKKD